MQPRTYGYTAAPPASAQGPPPGARLDRMAYGQQMQRSGAAQAHSSDWPCAVCKFSNYATRSSCHKCATPRGSAGMPQPSQPHRGGAAEQAMAAYLREEAASVAPPPGARLGNMPYAMPGQQHGMQQDAGRMMPPPGARTDRMPYHDAAGRGQPPPGARTDQMMYHDDAGRGPPPGVRADQMYHEDAGRGPPPGARTDRMPYQDSGRGPPPPGARLANMPYAQATPAMQAASVVGQYATISE